MKLSSSVECFFQVTSGVLSKLLSIHSRNPDLVLTVCEWIRFGLSLLPL